MLSFGKIDNKVLIRFQNAKIETPSNQKNVKVIENVGNDLKEVHNFYRCGKNSFGVWPSYNMDEGPC